MDKPGLDERMPQGAAAGAQTGAAGAPTGDEDAARRLDPGGQQVSSEDPLDRLVGADVERHAHRVGVLAAVVHTGHKWNNRLLWDNKPKTKLGRDRGAAVSGHRLPTST